MNIKNLIENDNFKVINIAEKAEGIEIKNIYCCDLLSMAMSKMPEKAAWVTVMSNVNSLAVASLAHASCIVFAEGVAVDEAMKIKAEEHGITVISTALPIFEAALLIRELMN